MEAALFSSIAADLGISSGLFWGIFAVVALWTIVLKGFALWHSARNYQKYWFIFLLIVNTFGILELIYLVWFKKDKSGQQSLFTTQNAVTS